MVTQIYVDNGALYGNPIPPGFLVRPESGTSYTFGIDDIGNVDGTPFIRFTNNGTVSVTVPPNASVEIPIGSSIAFQYTGTGDLLVFEGTGVTINQAVGASAEAGGQNAVMYLIKVAVNEWIMGGNLAA